MAIADEPSEERSGRLERSQDTSPSSLEIPQDASPSSLESPKHTSPSVEISICKEQPTVPSQEQSTPLESQQGISPSSTSNCKEHTSVPSQEEPRPLECPQDASQSPEPPLRKEQPSESCQEESTPLESPKKASQSSNSICKVEPSIPSQEASTPLESPQDTTPSSTSICKEKPSVEPNYAVEKSGDKDNAGYVATWKHRLNQLLPLTSLCAIGAYWLYVAFRVRYTTAAQHVKGIIFPVAWVFLSIELGVACEPPDNPRLHCHGFLLMRMSHSTITALPVFAISFDQDSPPP